jgi:hypothetical protein
MKLQLYRGGRGGAKSVRQAFFGWPAASLSRMPRAIRWVSP